MSRTLVSLLCASLLGAAAAAQAQTTVPSPSGTGNSANFAQHKQQELSKIQQRMQVLQQLQSCVNAATTHDAVKQCNETAHSEMGNHQKKC